MKFEERYPDLIDIQNGGTWAKLFEFFYILAQVRYATKDQLNKVDGKFGTSKKLERLKARDYLSVKSPGVYIITEKTRQIISLEGYNTSILQSRFTGDVLKHELIITDCLINLRADDNFYRVFYPIFREPPDYKKEYLRPDGCLVWKNKENQYKLQFFEVEQDKPNWSAHLKGKKRKYETIAGDLNTWDKWWRYNSEQLQLPFCKQEDFCFSILCFSKLQFEWEGWEFNNEN